MPAGSLHRPPRLTAGSAAVAVVAAALAPGVPLGAGSTRAQTWKREKRTSDGIVIYSSDSPGSPVKQVKAETVVDATPAQVWQALMDRDTYEGVSTHGEKNVIYKTEEESVWHKCQLLAYPMISRRDYPLRYESFAEPSTGTYRLVWTVANERGPAPQRSVVRITSCEGHLGLTPHGDGRRTAVVYWLHLDPGGSVPAWVANAANRSSVPDLLRAVRDAARQRRDQRSAR
jgi:hypothetical protein